METIKKLFSCLKTDAEPDDKDCKKTNLLPINKRKRGDAISFNKPDVVSFQDKDTSVYTWLPHF